MSKMSVSKPLVLATILLNGNEILKKPVRANTMEELQRAARSVCPSLGTSKLQRILLFDKTFDEYIDVEDHVTSSHEKFLLHFSTCNPSSQAQSSSSTAGTQKDKPNNKTLKQVTPKVTKRKRKVRSKPPIQSFVDDTSVDEEELKHKSQIFGKSGGKLNRYQQHINKEAFLLVKANPALLENRGHLLTAARKALHDCGYDYAHGNKTRSKVLGKQVSGTYTKTYSRAKARNERLEEIADQTRSLETQLEYFQKGKEIASASQMYEEAAAFEQQAEELRSRLRQLGEEQFEINRKTTFLLKKKNQRKSKARRQGTSKQQPPSDDVQMDEDDQPTTTS
ncbi:uncharacterized protein LOC119724498 [Patiria miniata]|uniref:NAB co-repressor domain-containing protein n=1 Tax=Patiria miniata TaxID=46514 RepID=A0A913ZI98_PATMI|nr:uncharacterized protein LOC119724498 [Patiria miniata]